MFFKWLDIVLTTEMITSHSLFRVHASESEGCANAYGYGEGKGRKISNLGQLSPSWGLSLRREVFSV